jgi:tetratricopeptide (TPR) repeat protein
MTEPLSIDEMFDRAHAALRADDWATAERGYRALMDAAPYDANQNLGTLCLATRRFAEAEAYFRAALAVDPEATITQHSLALLLLGGGQFAEGWQLYESRRETPGSTIPRPPFSYPEWRGEPLVGKELIMVGEQGFGDQIMFARFIPELER